MHDQNGVGRFALLIRHRLAASAVMQIERIDLLSFRKLEILDLEVAFVDRLCVDAGRSQQPDGQDNCLHIPKLSRSMTFGA